MVGNSEGISFVILLELWLLQILPPIVSRIVPTTTVQWELDQASCKKRQKFSAPGSLDKIPIRSRTKHAKG